MKNFEDNTAADFELDERHVIRNEKFALDRLRVRQNVFLVIIIFNEAVIVTLHEIKRSKDSCYVCWCTGDVEVGEYCHAEIFRASCAEDEVVLMERALYGRMSLGRCVELDMGHLGCQSDVLALADRRCSGRRSCLIRVPDAELESRRPCLRELKTYLFASYRCVHGTPTIMRQK